MKQFDWFIRTPNCQHIHVAKNKKKSHRSIHINTNVKDIIIIIYASFFIFQQEISILVSLINDGAT